MAEEVPIVADLQQEIDKLQSGDVEALEIWKFISNDMPVAERISELRRYIEWRCSRQSPPHCLEYGALNPVRIPIHGEFAHPHAGERVIVISSGFADSGNWEALFSPEGVLLPPH